MWCFHKPAAECIREFLERQRPLGFSYAHVGMTRNEPPADYDHDHHRVLLGRGRVVFEAACAALGRWRMFPGPWALVEAPEPPIQEGQTVAVLFRVFGLWWLNACRIVYVVDETQPVRRFGFAYGTLPEHVERGEELFSVERQADDAVWYDLRAFSRPRHWLARLGYPVVRRLQRRFVRESQAAMQEAVAHAIVKE